MQGRGRGRCRGGGGAGAGQGEGEGEGQVLVPILQWCLRHVPCSTLPTEWAEKLRALIQIHGPIPVKVAAPPAYPADTPREPASFVGLVCAVCLCVCMRVHVL